MSEHQGLQSEFIIAVDGTALANSVMEYLIDVVVEDDLAQPSMFVLRFHDPEFSLTDGAQFNPGKEVTISAKSPKSVSKVLLVGEVTSLEPEFSQYERTLVVRGYDRSHRLYRGRKTRTFLNQTDSAMASQIAQEAGFSAQVTATTTQHAYVMQDNQTDMEFLRDRAARIGYQVLADGQKLKFVKSDTAPPAAPAQEWGVSLTSFHARLSAVAQPNTVKVQGWDPKLKQPIVGTASTPAAPSTIGYGKTGGQAAQTAFGSAATVIISDIPVGTQAEAATLAQATLDRMAGDHLAAEGQCFGEPGLKAGTTVQITGVGTKFSGTYFVSATRHEFTPQDGYQTTFQVNGRRPASLVASLSGGAGRHFTAGVVLGVVTNINDPDSLGRVKVKFPWLDDTQESTWASVIAPGAGNNRGFIIYPEVNDQVLVAFEHGDISRPYVLGGVWSSSDAVPVTGVADGKVKLRAIKSRAGHRLEFAEDDGADKGAVTLTTIGGRKVVISDTDKGLDIISEKHSIKLDDQGNAVKITSGGTLEISAGANKLSFTSSGLELTGSGGKLAIAAAGVELSAQANMTVKANANCDVQANAMMNLKSSAILNIQGTLVKIN